MSSATTSKPLTRYGQSKLAEEHEWLARHERPKVLKKISDAAAEGDRSENAEYIYGKKRLREIDKRLRYLDRILTDAKIVDQTELKGEVVCFGATVTCETESGDTSQWMIVGEGETEYQHKAVSWRSPVAKALWGKKVGDLALIKRPRGDLEVEIIEIEFLVDPKPLAFDFKFEN